MQSHETLINAHRALVLRHIGIEPSGPRVLESQVGGMLSTGTLLRLPPMVVPNHQDPVTGALPFTIGRSELGGPDPLT